jgi:hypothetical protein
MGLTCGDMSSANIETSARAAAGSRLAVNRRDVVREDGHASESHTRHQLLWAPVATLSVQTEDNNWVVPPTHGLWIPAGVRHSARVLRTGRAYVVYLTPGAVPWTGRPRPALLLGR